GATTAWSCPFLSAPRGLRVSAGQGLVVQVHRGGEVERLARADEVLGRVGEVRVEVALLLAPRVEPGSDVVVRERDALEGHRAVARVRQDLGGRRGRRR